MSSLELRYGIFHFLTKCPPNVNSSQPSGLSKELGQGLNLGFSIRHQNDRLWKQILESWDHPFLENWNWPLSIGTDHWTTVHFPKPTDSCKKRVFKTCQWRMNFTSAHHILLEQNANYICFTIFIPKENYYWVLCFFGVPHKLFNRPSFRIVDSSAI